MREIKKNNTKKCYTQLTNTNCRHPGATILPISSSLPHHYCCPSRPSKPSSSTFPFSLPEIHH